MMLLMQEALKNNLEKRYYAGKKWGYHQSKTNAILFVLARVRETPNMFGS